MKKVAFIIIALFLVFGCSEEKHEVIKKIIHYLVQVVQSP